MSSCSLNSDDNLTVVMKKPFTFALTTAIMFSVVGGLLSSCGSGSSIAQSNPQPAKESTLALLFIKRDNLTQQYRSEIFPIARYSKGRYQDASLNLTLEMREDANEAAIVKAKANVARSLLKPNQTFTAYNAQTKLGNFKVERLGVGQFACSAYLVGRSNSTQPNLQSVYNAIPRDQESTNSGYMFGKKFDETQRWVLAGQNVTPATTPRATDLNRYPRDITAAATSMLNQNPEARKLTGRVVVENFQVYDLDRDGKPEVFAQVRKGQDPKTIPPSRGGQGAITTVYATLWLNYRTDKPNVIANEVIPYTYPVSRIPYNVLGVMDINGDGIAEAIVRNNGYESTSFRILEYKDNQLRSVFSGAEYGC